MKLTARCSHLAVSLAIVALLCAAQFAQAESLTCADIIRGVREKMDVSIEEGSPRDALEALVALSPFVEGACAPKVAKKAQSTGFSPGSGGPDVVEPTATPIPPTKPTAPPQPTQNPVQPTATPGSGPSQACQEAQAAFAQMQLTLTSAEQQLKKLNEQIKSDQAQWDKKQERVRELKDQIRMTKGLYQQALERVLRVHPKWEDVLHAYLNNSGRWSMWVTRWPQLGEWVRTVQKYEDRLFKLEGEVVPLVAAQNVLAKRINDMKETRKDAQREVNRLSNVLKKLREKMESACRRSR